jgi:hypothetical protein
MDNFKIESYWLLVIIFLVIMVLCALSVNIQ